ncbi:MAG: EAL domain-containing protein [Quadrisphaera sp.]
MTRGPLLLPSAASAAALLAWVGAVHLSAGTTAAQAVVQSGLLLITLAASTAVLVRAAQRPGAQRFVNSWLGASLLLWGCASASTQWRGWASQSASGELDLRSTALYSAAAVAGLVSLAPLAWSGTSPSRLVRDVLDCTLLVSAACTVVWHAALAELPPTGDVGPLSTAQAVVLVGQLLVLVVLLNSALRARAEFPALVVAALSLSLLAVVDVAAASGAVDHRHQPGDLVDVGWFCAMALMLVLGCWAPHVEGAPELRRGAPALDGALPYAAVVVSTSVSVVAAFVLGGAHDPVTSWLHLLTLLCLVLRTVIAIRQSDLLARDLDSRVRDRTRELDESHRRYASLVAHSSDLVCVVDAAGVLTYASPSAEQVLGRRAEDLVGTSVVALLAPGQLRAAAQAREALLAGRGTSHRLRTTAVHATGRRVVLQAVLTDLRHDPAVRGLVVNARDTTDAVRLEEELSRQAFNDSLTGLPNRALFNDRLEHALRARRDLERTPVKVCYLDLDGFKAVNDTLGHGAGDELLVAVAERLRAVVREGDTVARLGGDEFAVLLQEASRPEDAERLARRICDTVRRPFAVRGAEVTVAASVGLASTRTAGDSAEQLMRAADLAMYRAKGERRGGIAVYHPDMHRKALDEAALEADLRRALPEDQLRVVYQPLVDMATGAVSGVEALVRWQHPSRGLVSPLEFVPLAEQTGLIDAIGEHVLRVACTAAAGWRRDVPGAEDLHLSVNVSGHQLHDPALVATVATVLQETGLPAGALVLEVTETVLVDQDEASLGVLHGLRAAGVRLAIDDFGTGYSSLSYLHRLPVDILKIDKSFVDELTARGDASLVDAIISMAASLELTTVAEGVEHEHQRAVLEAQGCPVGQGYHFSPPVAAEVVPDVVLAALAGRPPGRGRTAGGGAAGASAAASSAAG